MKLATIYASMKKEITLVEKELEASVQADDPVLQKASGQLIKAGGKRLRPVFVLLAARFGNYDFGQIKHVAVTLELIHTASLVHDDVIDDSDTRRGLPTVKAQWDNQTAMYAGDYLFAKALEHMTCLNKPEAHKALAHTIYEVTVGEIEQIRDQYNWDQTLRHYLRRIKRKTALLIAASCKIGAISADLSDQVVQHFYRFGYFVGMAFQITDDILDYVGTEKELGKPAGGDLKQGNITLPALYAFCDPKQKALITSKFSGTDITDRDLAMVLEMIKQSGGIEKAREVTRRYLAKAYQELDALPDHKEKNALRQIAQYIEKRNY